MDARTEREKRLDAALRQNLRRRKQQARDKDAAPEATTAPPPADEA